MRYPPFAPVALAALGLLLPSLALADANITVDGSSADWGNTATCFKPSGPYLENGSDSSGFLEISEFCIENNNSRGSAGFLYGLFRKKNGQWPSTNGHTLSFGFILDTDDNGTITDADDLWEVYFSGPVAQRVLRVVSAVSKTPRASNMPIGTRCGTTVTNTWTSSTLQNAHDVLELGIGYGCLGLTYGQDVRVMRMEVYADGQRSDATDMDMFYNGTTGGFQQPGTVPGDVRLLTAVAGNGTVRLTWDNPTEHEGVVVLRSTGAAPTTAPTKGVAPAVGATVGNAQVVFSERWGTSRTFLDTGLTNGTRYYYKVYNHHLANTFSAGSVPTSTGLFAEPTSRSGDAPRWCYSTGFSSLQQPVTELGAAVFTSGNLGLVTANITDPLNASRDGTERFRPVQLDGAVKDRFLFTAFTGSTSKYLVTGDQTGRVYAIDSATGAIRWRANNNVPLGDMVQAQPIVQLYDSASTNAAFRAAHPNTDLIFVGTRNTSATNNKVYALRSRDGSVAWTYAPGDLDIITGGVLVDYGLNRVWVGAYSNKGTQASLRVLDSVTGAELARYMLGDIDTGVVRDVGLSNDPNDDQAFVVSTAGVGAGINLATLAQDWTYAVGPTAAYLMPAGRGFIASLKSGQVQRYAISGSTVTPVWTTAPSVANPSGVRIDYATQKIYVGSSDGKLHQLDVKTGKDDKQFVLAGAGTQVGTPTIDTQTGVRRLHVGLIDGRLCAIQLP